MNRSFLAHPLLVALAPVLFVCAHNANQVDASTAFAAVGGTLAGTLVVLALCALAFRDVVRGAILTSLFAVLFFLYGRMYEWAWEKKYLVTSVALHGTLVILCIVLLGACVLALVRTTRDLKELSAGLTRFSGLLVLWSAGTLIWEVASRGRSTADNNGRVWPSVPALRSDAAETPDIYYIIMDGYARQDVLKDVYKFDNSAFIAALRKRGFFVAEHGRSNYPMTHLSLASTLSLRYLTTKEVTGKGGRSPMYKRIRRNEAAQYLQGKGYRYVHFNTNYGGTETSSFADIRYSYRLPVLQTELMSVLLRTTMLRPFEPSVAHMDLFMLDKVTEVPDIEGPTFTFLHLLLPHNPYVFDREGNIRADIPLTLQFVERTGGWGARKEYIDQLIYLNRRMEGIIDALIARSATPPIIILQSDHGSSSLYRKNMSSAKKLSFYNERTANFNAWYAPANIRSELSDDMVPVNTFRLVFRQLFGAAFPTLEKHIYMSWYGSGDKVKEITGLLDLPPVDPSAPAADVP